MNRYSRWNSDPRLDALIEEIMDIFHVNRSEAATTALSMIIREYMLAAEMAEVAV